MSENKSYGNVSHALDILLFFRNHKECSLNDLSELLKIRKSYLLKLLDNLREKGLIDRDPESGKFRLGLSCLELGAAYEKRLDIREIARPYLTELSSNTNELVHLGILDSFVVVLLERYMNYSSVLRLQFHLSITSPPYSTGLGKVLLAYSDRNLVENYLATENFKAYSPRTTISPDMISVELEQIRQNGYYLSYETYESGISCVAAPVFARNGKVSAAVSICAPTVRMLGNEINLRNSLLAVTSEMSRELGAEIPI